MNNLLLDLRFALRQLRRTPGFTAVAVLTLAIGIAASTAVFSLVDAVLLRPLPYPHPEQLVSLNATLTGQLGGVTSKANISENNSWLDFFDWRRSSRSFSDMAGFHRDSGNVGRPGSAPRRLTGEVVSAGMANLLGVRMALGRDFLPAEENAGNRSIVLTDTLWRSEFAAAPDVLGKTLTLNEQSYTVVGVLPASFSFPGQVECAFWITVAADRQGKNGMATNRGWHGIAVLGRLRPGVSLESGRAEVSAIQAQLSRQYPDTNADTNAVTAESLSAHIVGNVGTPLRILLAAVAFLLLIACVNVAGLLLTRAVSREGELAVRSALGATRGTIVRQLLLEAVTLSALGGLLGTALAAALLRIAPPLLPRDLPRTAGIGMDLRVLAFAIAASLLTGLLFGVLPAWRGSHLQPAAALAGNGRSSTAGRGRHRLHGALVVAETALSLLLLVGAGLLLRSFDRVLHVDPGFNTAHLLTFSVAAPPRHFTDPQQLQFATQLRERLAALPGVSDATYGFPLPLAGANMSISFGIPGRPTPPTGDPSARASTVAANFFSTLRVPLVQGRYFTPEEDRPHGPHSMIVNQSFASHFFPGESALGKHLQPGIGELNGDTPESYEIVGIVGNTKRLNMTEDAEPEYFLPFGQSNISMPSFAVRTAGDPLQLAEAVRRVVTEQDASLPVYAIYSYDALLGRVTAMRRFQTALITGFAGVALLLAAIGLYASLSYMVQERTPELGLRMALGSERGGILALVLRRGLSLAVSGLALGLLGAAALSRLVGSLLYQTRTLDALTFAGTALLLFAVCAFSSFFPAWRASRLNPIDTLRQQ